MFASKDALFAKQASSAYQISRSLRFRSSASAYLSRTMAMQSSRTLSMWVKRGAVSVSGTDYNILFNDGSTGDFFLVIGQASSAYPDKLRFTDASGTALYSAGVLRDPSAWYHIVVSQSSTATSIYINGVLSNSNSRAGVAISSSPMKISHTNTTQSFDGYLAEVNFIDGQALTPSSFGAFDTNGVWQPKAYTGTYGTNGFYLPFSASVTSTYAGSFSTNKTITTPTTNTLYAFSGDFTVEGWINPSSLSGYQGIIAYSTSSGWSGWQFTTNGANLFFEFLTGSAGVGTVTTSSSPLTANVWQHVAAVRSGSTITIYVNGVSQASGTYASVQNSSTSYVGIGSDRTKNSAYFGGSISNIRVVNGTAVYTANFVPSSNPLTAITNTQLLTLQNSSIVDNSANAQTLTNNNTVTTSAATPWSNYIAGVDSSGLNNNWASANVNVTSSGTTYDSMIDSPTNYADGGNGRGNYPTLNPLTFNSSNIVDGNLAYLGANYTSTRATFAVPSSGKWYWELTPVDSSPNYIGFGLMGASTTGSNDFGTAAAGVWGIYPTTNMYLSINGSAVNTTTATPSLGCTFALAYDASTGNLWIGYAASGAGSISWFNSTGGTTGNPATGANPVATISAQTLFPAISGNNTTSNKSAINFGQRPFTYTPPSGYSALNTQNLPTPTIAAGNKYFDALTWMGDNSSTGTTKNRTGLSFQPDFVWIKNRGQTYFHNLYDAVRGTGSSKNLISNGTNIEGDSNYAGLYGYLSAFNSDGFQTTNGTNASSPGIWVNQNSETFVAWNWNAGGAPTTDNVAGAGNVPTAGSVKINGANSTSTLAGSIAATRLSANTSAGFSVVTGVSIGTSGSISVGHGLGVTPSMVIFKNRDYADAWYTWHTSLGASTSGYNLKLNLPDAIATNANIWGGAGYGMTSTTIGLGQGNLFSASNQKFVCYAFAPVAGYSSFGSFVGTNSTDNVFVYLGFRPRYLLIKNTTSAGNDWVIYDSSRTTYNPTTDVLWADLSVIENNSTTSPKNGAAGSGNIDFLSNGFKVRSSASSMGGADTYIYAAFAETPFKTSRAR